MPAKPTKPRAQTNASPETKSAWRRVRFGDVVRFVKEDADPESGEFERYVAGEHIETDNLHIRKWGTIGDGYLGPAFHRRFKKGQVLYGSRRTYLRKVAVADFDGITANTTFVLEPSSDELIPELLPFVMQTDAFNEHSVKQSKGSVNPYINFKDIAWFEFSLPPKDEQRRIADILWAADGCICGWLSAERELKLLLGTIRQNLVCDPSFPRKKLAEGVNDIIPGRSLLGASQPATESEYGVLKVSAVGANGFAASENKRLLRPDDFRAEFSVKQGDFLITRCNTRELVGRVCIVADNHPRLMLCDKTIRLEFRDGIVSKVFMLEALRSKESRDQIEAIATGTGGAMKNISQGGIRGLIVPLPAFHVQKRVELVIQEATTKLIATAAHLEQTANLKSVLVNQLLKPNHV